jgi:hypothetical protein
VWPSECLTVVFLDTRSPQEVIVALSMFVGINTGLESKRAFLSEVRSEGRE